MRATAIRNLAKLKTAPCGEEMELVQRQFMLVRPENRLVADSLERRWNEKLAELSKAEEEYARAVKAKDPDQPSGARAYSHAGRVCRKFRVWSHTN